MVIGGLRPIAVAYVVILVVSAVVWGVVAAGVNGMRGSVPLAAIPIALSVVLIVLRRPLGSLTRSISARSPRAARAYVAPLLTMTVFEIAWAASYGTHPNESGLLPQILFPSVVGVYAFAVARWGDSVLRNFARVFARRDALPVKARWAVVIVAPIAVAALTPVLNDDASPALAQQLAVLVGLILGSLMLLPRAVAGERSR